MMSTHASDDLREYLRCISINALVWLRLGGGGILEVNWVHECGCDGGGGYVKVIK